MGQSTEDNEHEPTMNWQWPKEQGCGSKDSPHDLAIHACIEFEADIHQEGGPAVQRGAPKEKLQEEGMGGWREWRVSRQNEMEEKEVGGKQGEHQEELECTGLGPCGEKAMKIGQGKRPQGEP